MALPETVGHRIDVTRPDDRVIDPHVFLIFADRRQGRTDLHHVVLVHERRAEHARDRRRHLGVDLVGLDQADGSSTSTRSPSCFSHSTSVASSIVRPHLGSTTGVSVTPYLRVGPFLLGDDAMPPRTTGWAPTPPCDRLALVERIAGLYPLATPRRAVPQTCGKGGGHGEFDGGGSDPRARANALGLPQVLFCIVTAQRRSRRCCSTTPGRARRRLGRARAFWIAPSPSPSSRWATSRWLDG